MVLPTYRPQGWQSNVATIPIAPSNLVAQGTVQALYPYTMTLPVTFGVLLESGMFTAQVTLPALRLDESGGVELPGSADGRDCT